MTTKRFHISADGPRPCKAKSDESCPVAKETSDSLHYTSMKEAQEAFEDKLMEENPEALSSSNKKIKVIDSESDPFSLVEDPAILESGAIIRAEEGTLLIASDNLTYNEFGNYMVGNLTNDPAIAKKLHELDPLKKYQEGSCETLSFTLYESCEDIVGVDELVNENGEMWHSIARHKDGYYVDSLGKWNEQDLFDYWETIGEREDEGTFEWRTDVQDSDAKPNFKPQESLDHLATYLRGLL